MTYCFILHTAERPAAANTKGEDAGGKQSLDLGHTCYPQQYVHLASFIPFV